LSKETNSKPVENQQREGHPVIRRDYDIFEKFPDGSTLWRACVSGRYAAQRKMQEMGEYSNNEFFVIDIQATEFLPDGLMDANQQQRAKSATAAAGH
jgi:hypothetical protein